MCPYLSTAACAHLSLACLIMSDDVWWCNKQAGWGIPPLYGVGALCMGLMVIMVWGYVRIFGVDPSLMKAGNKKKVS